MAIVGLALTSCEMFDTETKYYVKYEVEAVEGTDISDTCEVKVSYAWWQWIIRILLLGFLWY